MIVGGSISLASKRNCELYMYVIPCLYVFIFPLQYVRPGGGFVPNFPLTKKCDVNGDKEHPLFTFVKVRLGVL